MDSGVTAVVTCAGVASCHATTGANGVSPTVVRAGAAVLATELGADAIVDRRPFHQISARLCLWQTMAGPVHRHEMAL